MKQKKTLKKFKKFFSINLILILILIFLIQVQSFAIERFDAFVKLKISELKQERGETGDWSIQRIEHILFGAPHETTNAQAQATAVALEPSGYLIYHNASGQFLEESLYGRFPFQSSEQTVSYAYFGPGEYYTVQSTQESYTHVFTGEVLTQEQVQAAQEQAVRLRQELLANPNKSNLAHLSTLEDQPETERQSQFHLIANSSFFSDLKNPGYVHVGACGYIATGMVLSYLHVVEHKNTIPEDLVTYTASPQGPRDVRISPALTQELLKTQPERVWLSKVLDKIGGASEDTYSTYAWDVITIANSYLATRGYDKKDITHHQGFLPLAAVWHLKQNRPAVWMGWIWNNTEDDRKNLLHAIAIYGYKYTSTGIKFIAHFGWNSASDVTFNGIMGGYGVIQTTK